MTSEEDDQPIRRYFDPKGPNYVGSTESEVRKANWRAVFSPLPDYLQSDEATERWMIQNNLSYMIHTSGSLPVSEFREALTESFLRHQ